VAQLVRNWPGVLHGPCRFFRTELVTQDSTRHAAPTIADYAERTRQTVTAWTGMDGRQGGDLAKLAQVDAHRQLSGSLGHDDAAAVA
jgi:hypothetical protein